MPTISLSPFILKNWRSSPNTERQVHILLQVLDILILFAVPYYFGCSK